MNRPKIYHKSVDILYNAYFNDTLRHSNCYACAVGNLVAANMGKKFTRHSVRDTKYDRCLELGWDGENCYIDETSVDMAGWYTILCGYDEIYFPRAFSKGQKELSAIGYDLEEVTLIEAAFESAPKGENDEDWMFNGLVAVLEVLKEIHEVTDEEVIQSNHKKFKDHYQRKIQLV